MYRYILHEIAFEHTDKVQAFSFALYKLHGYSFVQHDGL